MPVQLRKRKNADGTTRLYLDIYETISKPDGTTQKNRYYETLTDCKLLKPSNPADREENRNRLNLAKSILNERQRQIIAVGYNVKQNYRHGADFLKVFEAYIQTYNKKDIRVFQSCLLKFKQFLKEEKNLIAINAKEVNQTLINDFKEYLEGTLNGEAPATYFKRFKKFLKAATDQNIFTVNPGLKVTIKESKGISKEILSIEDLHCLASTACKNDQIKNAFLFSCYSGLRWVDIKALIWDNIDLKNKRLKIIQSKTGHTLNQNLETFTFETLSKIYENSKPKKTDPVFQLPSFSYVLRVLKDWSRNAGIERNITWHSARHTLATNVIIYGSDSGTASEIMGHKNLDYIQRYVHIADEMKQRALANIPQITIA
jgi:integrase